MSSTPPAPPVRSRPCFSAGGGPVLAWGCYPVAIPVSGVGGGRPYRSCDGDVQRRGHVRGRRKPSLTTQQELRRPLSGGRDRETAAHGAGSTFADPNPRVLQNETGPVVGEPAPEIEHWCLIVEARAILLIVQPSVELIEAFDIPFR